MTFGNLDRRGNPAQRWLHLAKADASIRWSSGLAESAPSEAIVAQRSASAQSSN